jgi:hypothetical protein
MKMKKTKLTTAFLMAMGMASGAHAATEMEPNNGINAAQPLANASSHAIEAMMGQTAGSAHSDLDFYSFNAKAGDVLNLDIDNGIGGNGDVNTILGLYDANGNLLRMNAYSDGVDSGSSSTLDARIDNFVAPADGTYTVAVSDVPRYLLDNGNVLSFFGTPTSNNVGDYTLNISGITAGAKTQHINIEVKPGIKKLAPLNPKAKGKVPVAIMGSADFNVTDIKQQSLTFGSTGAEDSLAKCQKVVRDINRDGFGDLLCHFENSAAGFKSGDIEGVLMGEAKGGIAFEGRALIKVIPTKRK